MRKLPLEQPPTEDKPLAEWLARMMALVNGALDQVHDYESIYELPTNAFDGMVRLFGQEILPDIEEAGLHLYYNGQWLRIGTGTWDNGYDPTRVYVPGDIITVGPWVFKAIVETQEDPTPQPSGLPYWLSRMGTSEYTDNPGFEMINEFSASITTGQKYDNLVSGYITQLRVWVSPTDPNIQRVVWANEGSNLVPLASYSGSKSNWAYLTTAYFINPIQQDVELASIIKRLDSAEAHLPYARKADHFANSDSEGTFDPTSGDVSDKVYDSYGYGIDAKFQPAVISQDWVVVGYNPVTDNSDEGSSFTPAIFDGPGTTGYVPDPGTSTGKFLRDDGRFAEIPSDEYVYEPSTDEGNVLKVGSDGNPYYDGGSEVETGTTISLQAAEAIAIGDLCYLATDGMRKCDCTLPASANTLLGISQHTLLALDTGIFTVRGEVVSSGLTPGRLLYCSEIAGGISHVPPTDIGTAVRIVGTAISATSYFFDPDTTWLEVG